MRKHRIILLQIAIIKNLMPKTKKQLNHDIYFYYLSFFPSTGQKRNIN